jgi:hypothetical protein
MPDHLKTVTGAKKNCDPALAKLISDDALIKDRSLLPWRAPLNREVL